MKKYESLEQEILHQLHTNGPLVLNFLYDVTIGLEARAQKMIEF